MATTDAPVPPAVPPAPRRVRRRGLWLLLAAGLLLAGGLLGREAWGTWQESAARRALAEDRFDDARRHIELALRARDGRASTHLLAARIDRLAGSYAEAEEQLNRGGRIDGMSDPVQLEWLLLRCDRGEIDELAPSLGALVDRHHPDSGSILETLARVYMRQARYLEAQRCLDRWVELDPNCARAFDWRGWVGYQLASEQAIGSDPQAVKDYQRAVELQPGRSAARLRLASLLVLLTRYDDAVPHLERLRAEQPDNPDVLVGLARCRAAASRRDEARELLDAALAKHPDHFDALFQRGQLELEDSRFAEAEQWLQKAVKHSPHDPDARNALYLSLQNQPDRQREAREALARCEQDRKAQKRLTRLLRVELERRPKDAALATEAGELFLELDENDKALFWLRRALAQDPANADAQRALASYYERTGGAVKAEEQRRRVPAAQGLPQSP